MSLCRRPSALMLSSRSYCARASAVGRPRLRFGRMTPAQAWGRPPLSNQGPSQLLKDERAAFPIPALAGRGWSAAVVTERRPEVADPLRAVVIVEMLRFVGLPVSPQWGIRFWNLNGNLNG